MYKVVQSCTNVQDSTNHTTDTNEIIELSEEKIDYKKLPLNKLRKIVADKGLNLDTSKLKKQELLDILEKVV